MFERCYDDLKIAEITISQALFEEIECTGENQKGANSSTSLGVHQDQKWASYRERKFCEVQALGEQNLKYREIARQTEVDRRTVKKYLLTGSLPVIKRAHQNSLMVTAYQDFIRLRLEEGETNIKKLFQEIQSRGFMRSYSSVWRIARKC